MRQGLILLVALIGVVGVMLLVTTELELSRHRWWRRWRGGHWELVDFDRLHSPFHGRRWLRFERCSNDVLGFESSACLCCEDYTRSTHDDH